jgi:hypothetical protein
VSPKRLAIEASVIVVSAKSAPRRHAGPAVNELIGARGDIIALGKHRIGV